LLGRLSNSQRDCRSVARLLVAFAAHREHVPEMVAVAAFDEPVNKIYSHSRGCILS